MKTATLRLAKPTDAYRMVLRESDLQEAELMLPGVDQYRAIELSVANSEAAYSALVGADVICIWGCSVTEHEVHPWMMCADKIAEYPKQMLRVSREFLALVQAEFPNKLVCNYMATDNKQAKGFLQRLGFHFPAAPSGSPLSFFYLPNYVS